MNEVKPYSALFIDDQYKSYLPYLEPAADAAGIGLYAVDNVLEGLEFLQEYADILHAVILDLSFYKGEMQGVEALQKIKSNHPRLPVVILTDSDSAEDIEKVVQCIKKGAYNYVGKKAHPVYLFQVVQAAVEHSALQAAITYRAILTGRQEKFYTIRKDHSYGRFGKSAVFGFELAFVNKPGSEIEADTLRSEAIEWHQNLLRTISAISIIYKEQVQLNLKYVAGNRAVKYYLLITLNAKDENALEELINNIQHDVNPFFFKTQRGKNQPYLFKELTDETFLNTANEYSSQYKYDVFYREPVKITPSASIGFKPFSTSETGSGYNPDELFPFPQPTNSDNELFTALINQKDYAEIDLQLMPKDLMMQEIDLIRSVIRNPSSINDENLSPVEKQNFADYLQKFITAAHDKFMVSVILKRTGTNEEWHLKTAIQNYFFGVSERVGCEIRSPETLRRFSISRDGAPNQLPFFYAIHNAVQPFHLPFPGLNNLLSVQEQPYTFHQLPPDLSSNGILMGEKQSINEKIQIKISKESIARHMYIMGQTGTGKSTLLKTMIADCLSKNEGFTVIDPHGDLFDEVLKMIPKSKKKSLYIIDPTDAENSFGLNPLSYDESEPQAKSLVINELIRAFASFYDMKTSGGPMFETYFKNGMLLVLDDKVQQVYGNGTLADVVKVFHNEDFRNKLLRECGDQNIKDFFASVTSMTYEYSFKNFAPYITSKLTRFVDDYYLAPILTSKKKSIDFRALMDAGNILLVRMDKGRLGIDNTGLLGQIVLSNIFLSAMSRTNIAKEERKPYYIFVDEFQNFVKGDAGAALSEVRKYGLNLILANQTLGQLDDYLIQSLLGNVGSLVFFRPGINDYERVKHYLEPDFKREDILKLPNFNCIARLLIDNIPSDPFVFQTINI